MSDFTNGNVPGLATKTEAEEAQVTWAGRYGQDLVATRRVTIDAAATDGGNSPATTLRGGNVLAIVDASGKAHTYDPDANDGRQIAVGILEHYQNMLVDGVAADRFTQMLVHGLVKESELVGLDPRGKQQLAARFLFDRDLAASLGVLMHPRGIYTKSASYAVVAADNGLLFLATAAATVVWGGFFWGGSLRPRRRATVGGPARRPLAGRPFFERRDVGRPASAVGFLGAVRGGEDEGVARRGNDLPRRNLA